MSAHHYRPRRRPRRMLRCVVSVALPSGRVRYSGLFLSTSDAVIDALNRFPELRGVSSLTRGRSIR